MAARRGARTTLMDLARATGLSHMTVQRALLDNPSVRPETRAKVLEAAGRLGYRANTSARAMRKGSSGHIGLLLPPTAGSADPSALIRGIDAVLAERDLHVMPTVLLDAPGARMPRLIEQVMIDGLLIAHTPHLPSAMIEHLDRFAIPRIWINVSRSQDCVLSDGHGAGREATERLIALGHRRIVFLEGGDDAEESSEYHRGYVVAMQAAGLAAEASHGGSSTSEDWQAHIAALLASDPAVTAVVVSGNESTLWHLRQAIRTCGREISLVSLTARLPDYLGQGVPHYRLDQAAMGSAAARALLRKLDAPEQPLAPILVPFTWVDAGAMLTLPPR